MRFSGRTGLLAPLFAVVDRRKARRALRRAIAARHDCDDARTIDESTRAIASGKLTADELWWALRTRGFSHHELGHYELAIEDYDAAIRVMPDRPRGYTDRGWLHVNHGNYEAAAADYTKALDLCPQDADLLQERAMIWNRLGRREEAWADLKRVSDLGPDPNDGLNHIRMTIADNLHVPELTLDDFDANIRDYPENAWAYGERGRRHELRGALHEAIADYTIAVHLFLDEVLKQLTDLEDMSPEELEDEVENVAKETEQLMAVAIGLVAWTESIRSRL